MELDSADMKTQTDIYDANAPQNLLGVVYLVPK